MFGRYKKTIDFIEVNKIKSVLDWEMCTIGDPLMDLGTSLAYWTMDSDHQIIKEILIFYFQKIF